MISELPFRKVIFRCPCRCPGLIRIYGAYPGRAENLEGIINLLIHKPPCIETPKSGVNRRRYPFFQLSTSHAPVADECNNDLSIRSRVSESGSSSSCGSQIDNCCFYLPRISFLCLLTELDLVDLVFKDLSAGHKCCGISSFSPEIDHGLPS